MKGMKRLLAFLLAFVMVLSTVTLSAAAEEGDEPAPPELDSTLSLTSQIIKIRDELYEPQMTYNKGDKVYVELGWTLSDNFEKSEFTYPLKDFVVGEYHSNGTIHDKGQYVGRYWIGEDNELHIELTEEYAKTKTGRSVSVNLEGSFQVNETDLADGPLKQFHIGDKTLDLVVGYNENSVSLNKTSSSNVTLNDKGKFEVEYTMTIDIKGAINNLCIDDTFEGDLYLPEDGYEENFSFDFTQTHQGLYNNPTITYPVDGNSKKFTLNFHDQVFHDGDKITVTYTAYVTPGQVKQMFQDNKTKITNTAKGTYTSTKDEEPRYIPESAVSSVSVELPTLSKTGRWVDEGDFTTIEWTIIFNPGPTYSNLEDFINNEEVWSSVERTGLDTRDKRLLRLTVDSDLKDYLKEAFGVDLGLSVFKDTLGDGHHAEDGWTQRDLTLADFTWNPNTKCYELTYKTVVHGAQAKYTNNVETTICDQTLSGEDTVGIGYELKKEFTGKNEDGSMSWSVDIEIPNTGLSSWFLTDIPAIPKKSGYNNTALEKGWLHRVIPDSILVVALDSSGQPEGPPMSLEEINATVSDGSDKGGVVITFDVENSFIANKLSNPNRSERMIRLTLKTEVVDPNVDSATETPKRINEAFDESFYYDNTVKDTLTPTVGDEIKREANAHYDETFPLQINKGKVGSTTSQQTDIQWYVSISENFLHWDTTNKETPSLTGIVADGPPFELVLEDTLPEYMEYVEGSAYVTLSNYGARLLANSGRPDNIDEFNALLTKGLNVTDNGDGTITMKWELNDALAQDILNFTLKSEAGAEPLEAKVGDGQRLIFTGKNVSIGSWSNTKLEIYYNTRVTSYDDFVEHMEPQGRRDGIKFENTVEGKINGSSIGSDAESVTIYKEAELGKTLTDYSLKEYNALRDNPDYRDYFRKYAVNANGIYNLFFHIDVNPQKFVFGTDDGKLHLTDQMKGLGLVLDSVRVTDMDTGEILDKSDYIVDVDFKAKTVKFSVPDGRHFKIEYFTSIDANSIDEDGNISGISNEVSLDGYSSEPISTTIGPMKVLRSSAIATSANRIQLYKYYTAASGTMSGLSGAKFRIKPLKLEDETLVDADRNDMDNILDPGAKGWWQYDETDGYFYMEGQSDPRVIFTNLHTDYIYYVWESQIPDGYTKDKDDNGKEIEGYYFVLNTYKGAEAGALYELRRTVGSKYDLAVIASGDPQYIHNEQAPATVTLSGTKAIEGRDWNPDLDDGKYRFKLTAVTGTSSVPMPSGEGSQPDGSYVVANSGKNFYFPEFILSPGKYEYTISEVSPDDGDEGMIYSGDVYDVTVDVTPDTATDRYTAKVTYSLNGQEVSEVIFTNTVKSSGGSGRSDDSGISSLSVVPTEVPHTGDDSMITLWLLTMVASAIGIMAAFIRIRKRKSQ